MSEPGYDEVQEFVEQNSCPFVTSGDVAEEFPTVSDKTIRKRLNALVEAGELASRRVGAHAKVWYVPSQRNRSANSSSPSSLSQ